MLKSILNALRYDGQVKDTNYSMGARGVGSAVTLGARTLGGSSTGFTNTSKTTFDYLSNAENTIECYYQKLEDLKYYESHALTEKVVGIFRDYITQLWKDGADIIDIPGESPEAIEELNKELEGMNILEILMKDLESVIFYGSVSYEISKEGEEDPNHPEVKKKLQAKGVQDNTSIPDRHIDRNSDIQRGIEKDREKRFSETKEAKVQDFKYYWEMSKEDREFAKKKTNKLSKEETPKELIDRTDPAKDRGYEEARELRHRDKKRLNPERQQDAKTNDQEIIGNMRSQGVYKSKYRLNKLKHPFHTIVEYHRKEGRRYLVKANERYHIPSNKHQIFYYGNDSMRIAEKSEHARRRGKIEAKSHASNIASLVNYKDVTKKQKQEYKKLGIDPNDPKKRPTRYELMDRELSAGSPLFYQHLVEIRELYLKSLVVNILGIKDVIQPDILAMNFEGGTNIDHAQDLCNNLEDLLNKNSDYSVFNSAALNYNDLVKLLVDTFRILPDIDGKLQSLNPIRTTVLQEKIQQIRMECKEQEQSILSSLGVPVDLFEGQSSKWEVIKRSERLQSRVTYYVNAIKGSIRRLAQSVFYLLHDRELKVSDFKVTLFNESDLEMAFKTNKLQNVSELSQTLLNVVLGAERELNESRLMNKRAFFEILRTNLKETYPEIDDLMDIDAYMEAMEGQNQGGDGGY